MSLELVKESIKVNQVIGRQNSQIVIENDIIVPDVKPDVSSILVLDGEPYVSSYEVQQDKMSVSGNVRYKILYLSDNPEETVKSINSSVSFTGSIDIQDAKSGMKGRAECGIEHIDYEILNGRKINVKTILALSGKVSEDVTLAVTTDLRGLDDIYTRKEKSSILTSLGSSEETINVKEALQISSGKPSILDILRNDVKINSKELKYLEGKFIVKGELGISTLYIGDDEGRSIEFMENEIPFICNLPYEDASENTYCTFECNIREAIFEVDTDGDGEPRVITSNILIDIYSQASEKKDFEILGDAYAIRNKVSLEKSNFIVEEQWAESSTQVSIKDTLFTYEDSPEIAQVFSVTCTPTISDFSVGDDRVQVEGVCSVKMIYLAANAEQPIFCTDQEIPFRCLADVKGLKPGMACEVSAETSHCNFSMLSSTEVELRAVLGINTKVFEDSTFSIIAKAIDVPMEDRRASSSPSIIIYYAEENDTLWKVAKRYYTTVSDLAALNNLDEQEPLAQGQQVLIMKKAI